MNSRHELVAAKSPDPIIVTRALIKRAWSDFEPKVVSGLMSGTVSAGLLQVLNAYGIHTPNVVSAGLPVACYFLAAYLTPSVGTVTTVRTGDGLVVEKHSGSVEIKTGAIPIQPQGVAGDAPAESGPASRWPAPEPEPTSPPDDQDSQSQNFTQVISPDEPSTPPAWMSTSRGGGFLAHLPSSGGNPVAYHDNTTDDGH